MLEVKELCAAYGDSQVLYDVSVEINEGEIVTLIGSNGAGKSTFLKTICGWLKPKSGDVLFEGNRINEIPTEKHAELGIAVSPEGRRVFPKLTVLENLEMGAYIRNKKEIQEDLDWVYQVFPRLFERQKQLGSSLSGGEQQMLAIGRACMSKPKLLLLDEPSLGLAPVIVDIMIEAIKEINKKGVSICLIEQNAQLALEIANRGYVLEAGKVVMSGEGQSLLHNDEVKKAYLGL